MGDGEFEAEDAEFAAFVAAAREVVQQANSTNGSVCSHPCSHVMSHVAQDRANLGTVYNAHNFGYCVSGSVVHRTAIVYRRRIVSYPRAGSLARPVQDG